jgi:plasmid maintenance system killer protein
MTDTKDAPSSAASTEVKTPVAGNIVSRGPATIATVTAPVEKQAPAATGDASETPEAKAAREAAAAAAPPKVNDDQLKDLLKSKGIELDDKGIEGLLEKLKPAPAKTEPTAEEKADAEKVLEKRMLDKFISSGGTAENFVAFKQIAAADLTELSVSELKREMKADGFNDDEISEMVKERFYQVKLDEYEKTIEQKNDEETVDFEKRKADLLAKFEKKITYGAKRMASYGSSIQKQAVSALDILRDAIKNEDLEKQEEVKHSERVEDFFKKIPRKVTFELGDAGDGKKLAPIEYEVAETDIAEVMDVLKDREKRNNFLYNKDNSLNLDNLATVMLRNKYLESALKQSFSDGDKAGANREVEKFEKIFPGRTAKEIGVGGAPGGTPQGRKGVIASRGPAEPVRRN